MKSFISIIIISVVFSSCKKVITPALNDTAPQLIIDGAISDTSGPYYVNISRSVDFYSDNSYPNVSGAVIYISDQTAGIIDTLTEITPGRYVTHIVQGIPGNTYTLHVQLEGKSYTATSTMPLPVALDSVTIDYADTTEIEPRVYYQDPANTVNYYKYSMRSNGGKVQRFQTFEDLLSNGKYISDGLDVDSGEIKNNYKMEIFLTGIDKPVYNFFSQAEEIAYSNEDLAAPATPVSNISGGCIGYFSAQTVSSKRIVVKY
jgi:hypothetical protein